MIIGEEDNTSGSELGSDSSKMQLQACLMDGVFWLRIGESLLGLPGNISTLPGLSSP
jgi:hypothetical protein